MLYTMFVWTLEYKEKYVKRLTKEHLPRERKQCVTKHSPTCPLVVDSSFSSHLHFLSATELKFRADYNSTLCGVGVVVVVVVVVGVRVHFKNGITFERFEISA